MRTALDRITSPLSVTIGIGLCCSPPVRLATRATNFAGYSVSVVRREDGTEHASSRNAAPLRTVLTTRKRLVLKRPPACLPRVPLQRASTCTASSRSLLATSARQSRPAEFEVPC